MASKRYLYSTDRRSATALSGQCTLSAAVGAIAGWLLGLYFGDGAASMLFGAAGGVLVGLLVGVLIWSGSADLPEDRIQPVPISRPESTRKR